MSKFKLCPKNTRDNFVLPDITFQCTDGVVRAHLRILWILSKKFRDMSRNVEIIVNHTTEDVELALDHIYGYVEPTSVDDDVDQIPVRLYNIFYFLQVNQLTNYKYYIDQLYNPTEVDDVLDWIVSINKTDYPRKLICDVVNVVCATMKTGYADREKFIKLSTLNVDVLKVMFESWNNAPTWADWRLNFLSSYINADNYDDVRAILLPRTSMVSFLHNSPKLAKRFGLSCDIKDLLEHQLSCGYFYDYRYKYYLVKCENGVCTVSIEEEVWEGGSAMSYEEISVVVIRPDLKDNVLNATPHHIMPRKREQCVIM